MGSGVPGVEHPLDLGGQPERAAPIGVRVTAPEVPVMTRPMTGVAHPNPHADSHIARR